MCPSLRPRHWSARLLLDLANNDVERIRHKAEFEQWDRQVSQLWAELTVAVNSTLPPTLYALPDPFAPVITPNNSDIEMRGSLGERAVAIRLAARRPSPSAPP